MLWEKKKAVAECDIKEATECGKSNGEVSQGTRAQIHSRSGGKDTMMLKEMTR